MISSDLRYKTLWLMENVKPAFMWQTHWPQMLSTNACLKQHGRCQNWNYWHLGFSKKYNQHSDCKLFVTRCPESPAILSAIKPINLSRRGHETLARNFNRNWSWGLRSQFIYFPFHRSESPATLSAIKPWDITTSNFDTCHLASSVYINVTRGQGWFHWTL